MCRIKSFRNSKLFHDTKSPYKARMVDSKQQAIKPRGNQYGNNLVKCDI